MHHHKEESGFNAGLLMGVGAGLILAPIISKLPAMLKQAEHAPEVVKQLTEHMHHEKPHDTHKPHEEHHVEHHAESHSEHTTAHNPY
jgi:hypothetical protein